MASGTRGKWRSLCQLRVDSDIYSSVCDNVKGTLSALSWISRWRCVVCTNVCVKGVSSQSRDFLFLFFNTSVVAPFVLKERQRGSRKSKIRKFWKIGGYRDVFYSVPFFFFFSNDLRWFEIKVSNCRILIPNHSRFRHFEKWCGRSRTFCVYITTIAYMAGTVIFWKVSFPNCFEHTLSGELTFALFFLRIEINGQMIDENRLKRSTMRCAKLDVYLWRKGGDSFVNIWTRSVFSRKIDLPAIIEDKFSQWIRIPCKVHWRRIETLQCVYVPNTVNNHCLGELSSLVPIL